MESSYDMFNSELADKTRFETFTTVLQSTFKSGTKSCPLLIRRCVKAFRNDCNRSRDCPKTFLNSNYKYKRRYSVLSDGLQLIKTKLNRNNSEKSVNCNGDVLPSGNGKIRLVQILKNTFARYVPYTKMLNFSPINIFVIMIIVILGFVDTTDAGVCWLTRQSNGKCSQRYSDNISKEECCKHPNFGFTEKEMSAQELFFAEALDDGAMCQSCLDSCEASKCGTGKRCVYRKGRPKCICAPICRSSKKNKLKDGQHFPIGPPMPSSDLLTSSILQQSEPIPFFNFPVPIFGGIDHETIDSSSVHRSSLSPSSITSKTSTSIRKNLENNNNNFELRWRRESNLAVRKTQKTHETERPASNKRRKNQRKSNQSKRRKHSTITTTTTSTSTTTPGSIFSSELDNGGGDVEKIPNDKLLSTSQENFRKSEKIIIVAETLQDVLNSPSVQHRKASNSSRKSVVVDKSGRDPGIGNSPEGHHNRHQYKRQHQHQQTSKVNVSSSSLEGRNRNPVLQSTISLDDKIRSGFFSHGFPYPTVDETLQNAHGRYYNPVCGSDGKTYKTECQLKKRVCRRESTTLTVAYRGHCQTSCKLVRCTNNLTCVEDQYGLPHCISCMISCPQDDISSVIDPEKAVCGADGLTYKSVCDINRLICTTGRSISVAYHGFCQDEANCNTIQCRDKQICLNDLLTHRPRCISCSFKCPRKRRPQGQRYQEHKICGTDNQTYHSWCHMRRESCNTGFYIDVKHVGPCHKNSFSVKSTFT